MRYWLGPSMAVEVDPGFWGWGWPADCAGMMLVEPTLQPASGVMDGVALVWSETAVLGASWEPMGEGAIGALQMPLRARQAWQSSVGVRPTPGTLLDALWQTLTDDADPAGAARSKPIVPSSRGVLRLVLHQHGEVRRHPFRDASARHRSHVLAVAQDGLARARSDARAGRWIAKGGQVDLDGHRKALGYQVRKLGIDEALLRPPGWPANETARPPETSIQDTFNRSDGTPLGTLSDSSGSWTEINTGWSIASNAADCSPGATASVVYAAVALSGDDHHASATLASYTIGAHGSLCRKANNSTLTFYTGRFNGGNYQLYRFSSGSAVQIGSNAAGSISASDVVRTEADGSTITLYKNGSSVVSGTNTDITGNTYCGMRGVNDSAAWDQFDAADLAAGGVTIPVLYRHRQMQGMS